MSYATALILILSVSLNANALSEFQGYLTTNQVLRDRLFKPGSDFELGTYVGQRYESMGVNLLDLLGTYKTGFAGGLFRNGTPNSLNMLLWHVLFSKLAQDISSECGPDPALPLRRSMDKIMRKLCLWPEGVTDKHQALFDFWLALVAFDAPLSEFNKWEAFWLSPEMQDMRGAEAVEGMALSLLYNPYFLLRP